MAEFEIELEKIRLTYQKSLNDMKHELRIAMQKQTVLMHTVNVMADSIAQRNILIEELCECIEGTDLADNANVVQRGRNLLLS